MQQISHVSLMVRDQQEALDWYTQKLGWVVKSDAPFPGDDSNRWVTVAPQDQTELEVILQPAQWGPDGDVESRAAQIGNGPGFVIVTDNCQRECDLLSARGVTIIAPPSQMPWGTSALIADLYGYVHNLLEPATE